MDVQGYAAKNKTFPHQTTTDQFFDESQFESYRALGQHSIDQWSKRKQKASATPAQSSSKEPDKQNRSGLLAAAMAALRH